MGQAKLRGNFEQRSNIAKLTQQSQSPINLECRTCKNILNNFSLLRTSPTGAAWQTVCSCGAVTTAIVQADNSSLERTFKSSLALSKEITGGAKKISVNFLEKNIDTIETGLVKL